MIGNFKPRSEPDNEDDVQTPGVPQVSDYTADRENIYYFFPEEQLDFVATLLNFRNNRQVQELIQQQYSTTVTWSSYELDDPFDGYRRLLLEYFRIIDLDYNREFMKKYNLESNVTPMDIASIFNMPLEEIDTYKTSKISWKQYVYEILTSNNADHLRKQVAYVKFLFSRRAVSAHRRPGRKSAGKKKTATGNQAK